MGTSTLHLWYYWAEDDHDSYGDASMGTYTNRLAMLFCLQGGKKIGMYRCRVGLLTLTQFPLFNGSGGTRLKDDERIWGKVSRSFTSTLLH